MTIYRWAGERTVRIDGPNHLKLAAATFELFIFHPFNLVVVSLNKFKKNIRLTFFFYFIYYLRQSFFLACHTTAESIYYTKAGGRAAEIFGH